MSDELRLRAAVRPMVCGSMTTSELIREAEHAFPNPTPIIALMLARLRGERPGEASRRQDAGQVVKSLTPAAGLHCPACGAQLRLDINEDTEQPWL